MAQRITRAKDKIGGRASRTGCPPPKDLPARVSGVLAVLFLVFNEGYLATGPDTDPVRRDLTAEAIRLTRLIRELLPADGEVAGLLALMLLTEARSTARRLGERRARRPRRAGPDAWDAAQIAEGHDWSASGSIPGALRAATRSWQRSTPCTPSARDMRDTDWSQIVALYDQLARLDPSPIVALNRAIAVAELDGPEVALAEVDRLKDTLTGYHAFHATRAELLRRLGRTV